MYLMETHSIQDIKWQVSDDTTKRWSKNRIFYSEDRDSKRRI